MKRNGASLLLLIILQVFFLSAQARDFYWIGGSGNFNDIQHWSDQPGGKVNPDALLPDKDDNVYFDQYSFPDPNAEVVITNVARCLNMYWGNDVTNMPTLKTDDNLAHYLVIYGGVQFNNKMILDLDRPLYFRANTLGNIIDFGGNVFNGDFYFENNGGWRITSDLNLLDNNIYFNQGTISLEADLTCGQLISDNPVSRELYLNASTINLQKGGTSVLSIQADNLNLYPGTSKIVVSSNSSTISIQGSKRTDFYDILFTGDSGAIESSTILTTFNDVTFEMDGSLQGENDIQNLTFTVGRNYNIFSGTQNVKTHFEALGECFAYITIAGENVGSNISAESVNLDYLKVQNINASGTAANFVANNSYNLGGNTNWTFNAPSSATYTWVGGAGDGMWGTPANWDSGCVPSRNNDVVIPAGFIVEVNVYAECKSLDVDDSSTFDGTDNIDIYGSLAAGNCTWNYSGTTQFSGDNINTIEINNSFIGPVLFGGDGDWTLTTDISVLNILDLSSGNLITNGFDIVTAQFISTSTLIRTLDITNSNIDITDGVSKAWNVAGVNLTVISANSEIRLTTVGAEFYNSSSDFISYGQVSFNPLDGQVFLTNEGSAEPDFASVVFNGSAYISGNHQYDQVIFMKGNEYLFKVGSEQKISVADGLIAHGTCSEYITFKGDGGIAFFDCDVSSTDLFRLRIEDVNVTGGIGTLTANESIGISGYDGWVFPNDLVGGTIYWTGNIDNDWFNAGNWEFGCLPNRKDIVIFDDSRVTGSYDINISAQGSSAECLDMTWTNANLMSFSGDQPICIFGSLDFSGMDAANFAYSGNIFFKSENPVTIDASPVAMLGDLLFEGTEQDDGSWVAGSWTLSSELNTTGVIQLENGSLLTNNHDLAASSFISNFGLTNTRALTLGSSIFRLERFEISPEAFTFDAGTSEIIFTTGGDLIISKGPNPIDFHNVTFEDANGTAYVDNFSDDVFFNNIVLNGNTYFRKANDSKISFTAESIELAVGKTYVFESGQTFILGDVVANGACEGTIDITGSRADQAIFQAKTGVTDITVNSVNILNVKADPVDVFVAKASINLGGADGWKFEDEPAGTDLFWIGGTGNWDDPNHWATSSGAAVADGCVPTAKDNVFFDDGSFGATEEIVYTGASDIRCRTMDWTGSEPARPKFEMGTTDISGVYIYGSFILNSTVDVDLSPMVNFYFRATDVQEINTFGYVFPNIVEFDGNGGEWNLLDDLAMEGDCFIRYGKLITAGNDFECKSITSTDPTEGINTRGLDIQNSQVRITGREDVLGRSIYINLADAYLDLGFEFLSDNSTITFANNAEVFIVGTNTHNISFNRMVFERDGELDSGFSGITPYVNYLQFLGNGAVNGKNKFGTVDLGRGFEFTFQDGKTYEMDYLLAEGSCFAPITLHSSDDGDQTTILAANNVVGNFLNLKDIAGDASNGATYTAANSFDLGNVTGWTIDGAIAPIALYWVGHGSDDSWHNHENWSRAADGSEEGCVPTLNDDVFFTVNSFLGSKLIELLADGQCHNMTWMDDVDPDANFSLDARLQVAGFMDLTEGMTLNMQGIFDFIGDGLAGDKIVDFANKSMDGDIIFNGDGQSWIWNSELTTSGDLYLESGSVNTNINDFTIGRFSSLSLSDFDAVRKFDMTNSIATVTSDLALGWNMIVNTTGGLDFIATDSRIIFENGGGIYCRADSDVNFGAMQFLSNGVINFNSPADTGEGFFSTVQFFEQGQIYGDNTFENLEFTLGYENNIIESGKRVTVIYDLKMEGVRCSYIFLKSSSPGDKAFLYKPSGLFEKIYNASLTDISGSSGSGGTHPVKYKYDNDNSVGFVELPGAPGEENPPSFEDSFDQPREEWCSDVAVLEHVKHFPINSLTTFQWFYSVDGTVGSYTAMDGETNAVLEVSVTGFYQVDVMYGLTNEASPCVIKSVIEVVLGTKSNVSLEITANNVKCFGEGNGRVVAKVINQMYPDYQFTWVDEAGNDFTPSTSTNMTTWESTALNLSPGKYNITVADGKNCEFDTIVNIFDAYELLINDITTKDLTCYTVPEGEIFVAAAGGTGTLSYYLDNAVQASENITGLYSGDYTLFVEDANLCKTTEEPVKINSNPEIVMALNGQDLRCYNDNNGQFTPSITGGVTDYTYAWTGPAGFPGATTANISGLAGGTYELTLTDAVNCVSTLSYELIEPEELTTNELSIEGANCNGEDSGEIFVEAKQGTPGYKYFLNGVESATGTFSNLTPDDYTLRIEDANSCVFETSVTVNNPGKIGFEVEDIVLPTCENTSDGIIRVTPYGGNSGYSFSWSGPNDYRSYTQNIENIVAGEYSLLITDKKNCSSEEKVDLELGLGMQLGLVVEQHLTSAGSNNGILVIETIGGTPPYSFTVTGPGHSSPSPDNYDEHSFTVENLAGGVYTVVATDASGCSSIEKSIIIEEPGNIFAFIEEMQAVGCVGSPVGELRARASGGDGTYTYSWTGPSGYTGTGVSITGLAAGTYTLTATSAGQSAMATYNLAAPDPLLVSIANVKNVTCNNAADGEIELDIDFGSADYTIEWSNGTGYLSGARHILDLEPATYTFTVTSEYGCSVSGSQVITEPTSLGLTVIPVDISVAGLRDGELTATVTGGTSPYIFLVSGTGTNNYTYVEPSNISGTITVTGLEMGVYEVVVLDANECRIEDEKKVHEPSKLILFVTSSTDVTCPGGSDGAVNIGVLGESDIANLSFTWTGDHYFRSTDRDVSGIQAGTYTVTVYDSAGDPGYEEQSLQVIITEPEPVVVEFWKKDISCYGMNDGYINVHPQGGTPGYTYLWGGTGTVPTNEDQRGLSEGNYSVQITDSNGCKSEIASMTITEPEQIAASIVDFSEPTCYGYEDGWINLEISNGTEPYIVNWDNYGSITQNIFDLENRNYSFIVTDKNGCQVTGNMDLNEPDSLIAEVNDYLDIDCFGMNTGRATVDITGGTPDYVIEWSDGQEADEATGLVIGRYEVSVVDSHGCSDTSSVELDQPDELEMEVEAIRPTTDNSNDGAISINVTGGVEDYTIDWEDQNLNPFSGLTIEDLERGSYHVTVTDDNSCQIDSLIVLEYLFENRIKIPKAFTPNNDGYNDYWDLDRIEFVQRLKIIIYDRWGKTIYVFSGTGNEYRGNPWKGADGNSNLPAGSYYYAVELDEEKPIMGTVTILR